MYGILPVLFSFIGLTNNEFEAKKKAKLANKSTNKNTNKIYQKENEAYELKYPLLEADKYSD
jgi:hypothetical protein